MKAMLCEVADPAAAMAVILKHKSILPHTEHSTRSCIYIQVEKAVGNAKMLAFLVENAEDGRLLSGEFRRRKLWVDVYTMSHRDCPPQQLSSSELRREFASFNMQGYLVDFVKCPDIVKAYLCNFAYLHVMPYCKLDSPQVARNAQCPIDCSGPHF